MTTADETDVRNLQKQIDQIFESVEIQSRTSLAVSELSKLNQFVEFNRLRRFNKFFELSNHRVENTQSRCQIDITDDRSQEETSQSLFMRD